MVRYLGIIIASETSLLVVQMEPPVSIIISGYSDSLGRFPGGPALRANVAGRIGIESV